MIVPSILYLPPNARAHAAPQVTDGPFGIKIKGSSERDLVTPVRSPRIRGAMLPRLPVGHIPRSGGFVVGGRSGPGASPSDRFTIVEQNAADFGKLLVPVS